MQPPRPRNDSIGRGPAGPHFGRLEFQECTIAVVPFAPVHRVRVNKSLPAAKRVGKAHHHNIRKTSTQSLTHRHTPAVPSIWCEENNHTHAHTVRTFHSQTRVSSSVGERWGSGKMQSKGSVPPRHSTSSTNALILLVCNKTLPLATVTA